MSEMQLRERDALISIYDWNMRHASYAREQHAAFDEARYLSNAHLLSRRLFREFRFITDLLLA